MEKTELTLDNIYFDETINIDIEKLPKILKTDYLYLKDCYRAEKIMEFIMYVDAFEGAIKNCFVAKKITKKQQVDLFHVIGIYNE